MKKIIDSLIEVELRPALGCTEPISVALTASVAGKKLLELNDEPEEITVSLDKNVFKNGKVVEIPTPVPLRGNVFAAPLGAYIASPEKGLEILQNVSEEICFKAKNLVGSGKVHVQIAEGVKNLYVNILIKGKNGNVVEACSKERHDNLVMIKVNNAVIFESASGSVSANNSSEYSSIRTFDFYDALKSIELEQSWIEKFRTSISMNKKVMQAGLSGLGSGVGAKIAQLASGECSQNFLISRCAAAVDARMAGVTMPVMSVTGSGNQGLIIFLSHHLQGELQKKTETEVFRSLILAIFLASKIKCFSGRLSALCGCVIASGLACSAGLSMMEALPYSAVEAAFNIMTSDIMGILCDGAKGSCALKAATGVNSMLRSVKLAKMGMQIPYDEGIIGKSIDETIINIGKISNPGMLETDVEILKILSAKS
ncbi:MAG: serine dehydratase subunit alpha family protein [Candidatus Riflebacteria bacterium]|nr:serine dehydratase subunit alpha family protein [Candidatus Riflebacteria bacterium]